MPLLKIIKEAPSFTPVLQISQNSLININKSSFEPNDENYQVVVSGHVNAEKYFVNDSITMSTPIFKGLHPRNVDHVLSIIVIIFFPGRFLRISRK